MTDTDTPVFGPAAALARRVNAMAPLRINAERDRRIAEGFLFMGQLFQSRPEDQKRINGAVILALNAIMRGAQPGDLRWHGGSADFGWISASNAFIPMDAYTVVEFGKAAAKWESDHIFAARKIKQMQPIPVDYGHDNYWQGIGE